MAVVNQRLAGLLWPNRPAVGQTVLIGCRDARRATVVGVVRSAAVGAVGEAPRAQLFLPFSQHYSGGVVTFVVHTRSSASSMLDPIRTALRESVQGIRIYTVRPLSDFVAQSSAPLRWQTSLVTAFGGLALLLAAFGLYGVISYRVALRTPEIGVRAALGASGGDIFRDVVAHGLRMVLIGVAAGEVLVFVATRALAAVQSNVGLPALRLYFIAGAIWIAIAFIATYAPAARAARISPLAAFRSE